MSDFDFVPTNTMALSSFDVLKMDGVEDPLININKLATLDLDESYFASAVLFVNECNKEFVDSKIRLYQSISEAANEFVVLESFSDFFSTVTDIINKFLKFIKSLFDRFVTAVMKLVSSDKYITKHKEDFRNFRSEDEFDMYIYNFTFKAGVPLASVILTQADLFKDIDKTDSDKVTKQTLSNDITKASSALDRACDEFRGKVIGKDYSISYADFSNELYKVFRDDDEDTSSATIDASAVMNAYTRFDAYKKIKSTTEKERREIERAYELLKKNISDMCNRNGDLSYSNFKAALPDGVVLDIQDGANIPTDTMTLIDTYVKSKVDQIQEFSNIHVLAYSAKLDALKSCYLQDRNILYMALNKIQRTDSKRGVQR